MPGGIMLNPSASGSGDCCCGGGGCVIPFVVCGCVNPANKPSFFAGLTVSVYTSSGGTLLASGITDSSGRVTLSWSASGTATYWVTCTSPAPRWSSYAASMSLTCGTTTPVVIQLVAASGYFCCSGVDFPMPTTMTLTDANGSHTVTHAGAGWSGSYTKTVTPRYDPGNPLACPQTATGATPIAITINCGTPNKIVPGYTWWDSGCMDAFFVFQPFYADSSLIPGSADAEVWGCSFTVTSYPAAGSCTATGANLNGLADPAGPNLSMSE